MDDLSNEAHEMFADLVFTWENTVQIASLIETVPKLRLAAWCSLLALVEDVSEIYDPDGGDDLEKYMKMPEIRLPVWYYFLAHVPSVNRLDSIAREIPELREAALAAIKVHPESKAATLRHLVGRPGQR